MKYQFISKIFLFLLILTSFSTYAQTFEGWILYKIVPIKPEIEGVSDSIWQKALMEKFGEKGYMETKAYYQQGNYAAEIVAGAEKGFQVYNPKNGLLYAWQTHSDTAITINSKKSRDEFMEIFVSDKIDTIAQIPCNQMVVQSAMGKTTVWYNKEYFKTDAKYFKGRLYEHWEEIIQKIGCLPIKIRRETFLSANEQTLLDYEEVAVDKKVFTIPKFKVVEENPTN